MAVEAQTWRTGMNVGIEISRWYRCDRNYRFTFGIWTSVSSRESISPFNLAPPIHGGGGNRILFHAGICLWRPVPAGKLYPLYGARRVEIFERRNEKWRPRLRNALVFHPRVVDKFDPLDKDRRLRRVGGIPSPRSGVNFQCTLSMYGKVVFRHREIVLTERANLWKIEILPHFVEATWSLKKFVGSLTLTVL
mgnify:CR=1 FL=1